MKYLILFFNLFFSTYLWSIPIDTLPVVVHVIHTGTPIGSPDNPSDSLINELIGLMNDAFQKNGPAYGGADIDLAFSLAKRSPECGSTSGINRVDGSSVTDYETGGITIDTINYPGSAHEIFIKALSRWSNTDYINIWLVNMIDGNPNGLAGYAYFPQYNSALTDGIVLRANIVNGENKTIIHEFGHYFSLYHTFGDAWEECESETNCMIDGDEICDTEVCMFTFQCTETINPCADDPWLIADPAFGYTVLNNYMSYTNCQWMFTEDQKERMLDALDDFRPGLLSSIGSQLPGSDNIIEACNPAALNGLSPFYGIERLEFGSLNVYSNSSKADGSFYIDRACNQQISVNPGENIFLRVTPAFSNYSQMKVFLDFDHDGQFELPDELILEGNGTFIQDSILIPPVPLVMCAPLRLRVIADDWDAPSPTPCLLSGTMADGVGQIEDYAVIISPRNVGSLSSGNWNTPGTWSCNCVPGTTDAILINPGHVIAVTQDVNCASLILKTGAMLNVSTGIDVNVAGGCP